MTTLHTLNQIAPGLLLALVIRTLIEILRVGIVARTRTTIEFYVKASLVGAVGALVVLILHYFGLYATAGVVTLIIIVSLATWKVVTRATSDF